mgnify:CR=1 FL=1
MTGENRRNALLLIVLGLILLVLRLLEESRAPQGTKSEAQGTGQQQEQAAVEKGRLEETSLEAERKRWAIAAQLERNIRTEQRWRFGEAATKVSVYSLGDELHFRSELFEDANDQIVFVASLQTFQKDTLCSVGFRKLVLRTGFLDPGRTYDLQCL